MSDFQIRWEQYRQRTEAALERRLPPSDRAPQGLHEAMRYVCLDGGKRFRAMLVYACGKLCAAQSDSLDAPAAAVEMIHAYSLTHDDLPAMDDDELRRGRPTCHVAYDEATAVLVGDALQTLAFDVLAREALPGVSPERRIRMLGVLANASGAAGMAGGQALDMAATDRQIPLEELEALHRMKTGALIRASALLGGLASEQASQEQLDRLDRYAAALGLAFQISDDILDETQDSATLGKPAGTDSRSNKSTYVSLLGLEGARRELDDTHREAIETAALLGDNSGFLSQLADFVVTRSY